jgi:ribosomal protein S18 acetylase RimI-like enzyme
MDFTIRPARPAEFAALGEVTAQAYLADGLLDFADADPYLDKLRNVRSRAEHTEVLAAVADADCEVLGGVAFVAPGSPYADVAGPGEGEFRMLAVAPAARRRGVAEALVRACLDRARERGLERLLLSTHPKMLTAHRLYARLGFVRVPGRDWAPVPGATLWVFAAGPDGGPPGTAPGPSGGSGAPGPSGESGAPGPSGRGARPALPADTPGRRAARGT